ncbi:hypothetical protein MMC20_000443 [Loxospora ochrophaea]|nr:hypothetical protein [Loxospora ochrophaea]
MYFGIKPVFCDVTGNGNIDPIEISKLISKKTKAIVVTHMWGVPCEVTRILSILKDFPSIFLLEDCSHAHRATFGGQPVGTFGDGATWSLQGQKVVSGGEGGITLTKYKEFQDRQLLWDHYNKRYKSGLSKAHPLREYALTGAGLKNRAHPLAVAIAANQLRKLPDFLRVKQRFATKFYNAFSKVPFLQVPDVALYEQSQSLSSFYALIILFKEAKAPLGRTRYTFVQKLHEQGLSEVDIPVSTGLLHQEPLFLKPANILPHVYASNDGYDIGAARQFPQAETFYAEAIKLPVWAYEEDEPVVDFYIKTLMEVSESIL